MSLTIVSVIGVMTTVVAVLVKVIGLPDQIRKNHSRQSTEGLSVTFFLMAFLSYVLWTAYGLLKKDWVVALGQGAGVITTAIIAYQIWLYRGRRP